MENSNKYFEIHSIIYLTKVIGGNDCDQNAERSKR